MLARRAFPSQHSENVDSLPHLGCAGSSGRNPEEIRQTDEFSPLGCRGQRGRPTEQQWKTAGCLEKVLFLPTVMVAQQIAMIGKKTDQNVVGVWSRFDCIEDSAEAMIEISDLTVVARLHDFCELGVNHVSPYGVSHERDFFI